MKYIYILFIWCSCMASYGQDIVGQWETYDDKTKEKKSIVEIYKTNNSYFGKIIKIFEGDENAICEKCEGTKKDSPIVGLVIIEDLKKDDDEFSGGSILDPESGDTYKCYLKLVDKNKNKLKVRGFIGVSILGRTQYWYRKK